MGLIVTVLGVLGLGVAAYNALTMPAHFNRSQKTQWLIGVVMVTGIATLQLYLAAVLGGY